MTSFREIEYGGWSRCYELSNDHIDLVITGEVGPRIIRLGYKGERNLFCEVPSLMGKMGGDEWRIYGGHRFWHAPEEKPRTYYPDNAPVNVEQVGNIVRVTQPIEPTTNLQKQLDIEISEDSAHVRITHRLINHNMWRIEAAPWGLSVMATGGTAVVPHAPRGDHATHLLPTHAMTLWAYTDMSDPRWTWGERYVLLRQEVGNKKPQKIGMMVKDGWAAYVLDGFCFIKRFTYQPTATYPDIGCTVETFTNDFMLELETLGALTYIEPGASVEHVEDWYLHTGVEIPVNDVTVERDIVPLLQD